MTDLFLDPFQLPYMQRALVQVVLLGAVAGAVGTAVILRRLAFYGDVLTHTVFPGVALAAIAGRPLATGAILFALLTAVLFTLLVRGRRVTPDAALAILLTTLFAVGVAIVSRRPSFTDDLTALLFGSLLTVTATDILWTAAVGAVVLTVLGLLSKELLLRAFDPVGATALGYRTSLLDLVLNACVALVVVAGLQAVGTMLVLGLLLVPPVTARLLTDRLVPTVLLAALVGALGGALGLLVSYHASVAYDVRLGAGATVVAVLVLLLAAVGAFTTLRHRRQLARVTPASTVRAVPPEAVP